MMTRDMNVEFRLRYDEQKAGGDGSIEAKRHALERMLSGRRQSLVDYLEGQHYGEANARQKFARLNAEVTLLLIALRHS